MAMPSIDPQTVACLAAFSMAGQHFGRVPQVGTPQRLLLQRLPKYII